MGELFGQSTSPRQVAGVELLHPNKSGKGARNLDRRSPPDHSVVDLIHGNSPRRDAPPHTERNQHTGIPEGRDSHYRLSRSSRRTCSITSSETLPGGTGHETDASRFFKGSVRTPRATSRFSCSE